LLGATLSFTRYTGIESTIASDAKSPSSVQRRKSFTEAPGSFTLA
jgi:hypothetical protein